MAPLSPQRFEKVEGSASKDSLPKIKIVNDSFSQISPSLNIVNQNTLGI